MVAPDGKAGSISLRSARPESVLARAQVDDALQAAAGRKDPLATIGGDLQRAWLALYRLPDPRPAGHEPDELRHVGHRLCPGGHAPAQAAQTVCGNAHAPQRFSAGPDQQPAGPDVIEIGLLLGFGVLVFHMRVLGSLFSILLLAAIGAVSFGGLGLLTASRAQKIESVSGLMNLVMMPMWIFSGVFFSYERFPAMLQPFIKAAAAHRAE